MRLFETQCKGYVKNKKEILTIKKQSPIRFINTVNKPEEIEEKF